MTAAHHCRLGCGSRVILPYGSMPPLDWVPDHTGNIAAAHAADGKWHARYLRPGEQPRRGEKRYAVHAASCPKAQAELPLDEIARVGREYPDGVHTCAELQELEPGRRPCTCGRCSP